MIEITSPENETATAYLLRLAAAVLREHCPTAVLKYYDEETPASDFAETLEEAASDLTEEEDKTVFTFVGAIHHAGTDPDYHLPRVTFRCERDELTDKSIPFFKNCEVSVKRF